jgi:hypothetical protein
MSAHRRDAQPLSAFDERVVSLIEAAYADPNADPFELGLLAYELFCIAQPPHPMIPNLRPELFVSFGTARMLEMIVRRALSQDLDERFPTARAFADALAQAFGPYLVPLPAGADEELIVMGATPADVPFPALIAVDGVHAIDLLIEDPRRRLVLRSGPEALDLLDALSDCVLRRAPILIDDESARFPDPSLVRHRPLTDADAELLCALVL